MESRRKPKLSALLLVFGVVFALGVGLFGLLQLPAVRERLGSELRAAIRRELGLDADLESVRVAFPFALVGENIVLNHPQHGLLARAERLEVAPSLLSLARGKLRLKRILIEKPTVRLRVEQGRIVNLPTFAREPEPTNEKRTLPLRQLLVHDASLEIDGAPAYSARLEGVNIVLGVTRGTLLDLNVEARSGELRNDALREPIRELRLSGRVDPEKIQIDKAEFDSSVLKLSVSRGFLALPLRPTSSYSGRILLETELERLKSLPLGVGLPAMQGHVALNGTLSGTGADYRFRGHFHGDNPKIKRFGFGELDLKIEANRNEVKLLKGSQGRVVKQGGLVYLQGKLGLGPSLPLEVSADIQRVEFHKLMDQLGVTENCLVNWVMRGGFKLSGTANPVDVTGPIWTDTLHFRALTSAWHDPAAKEVIGTPPGRVTGRVAVRPDALRFENLHGRLPHSELGVLVHVGFEDKIQVVAKSDKFDLRDVTGLMEMPLAGAGTFSLDVGGTYDKTTLTGKLDLNEFMIDGYRVGHLRTRAVLEKGGVAVRFLETDVRKNDSHYVVDDMFLDFERAFSIDAKARFERLALADFYHSVLLDADPAFTPYQGHVKGRAEVRYTNGFPGDAPDGTLTVGTDLEVTDARIQGLAFSGGHVEARWIWSRIDQGTRGARLELDELRLLRGPGSLIARGKMEQGGALRMTAFAERLSM
ncbi:MAG TPA: hypothetical protein VFZ61_23280, partial [Polyangiales bacterium]